MPRRIVLHVLWLAPFLVLSAPIVRAMWHGWTRSMWDNGHGMFVPFLVVGLGYYALKRCPVESEDPSRWGFAFLIPALFLFVMDAVVRTTFVRFFALLLCLPGLSLLLLGPARTRALRFPLCLAFFMLPLPRPVLAPIHEFLQRLTTAGSEWVLHVMTLPALGEGTLLYLPHGTFRVVAECSGFGALYAGVTVALVLAYLSPSWKRRILLMALAAPLALAGNVLRIVGLAILAEWLGFQILNGPAHVLSGYASFVFTLGIIFLLAGTRSRSPAH
jgi:exosortase